MTFNPFAPIVTKLLGSLSLALLLVVAGMWWRIDSLASDNKALATRIIEQKAEFVAASEAAKAKQIALNIAAENKSAAIARKADADKQTALRTLADRYRDANRVPASCRPVRSGEAAKASPAGSGDSPGEATELYVAVSSNDYDLLIENSLRLERVKQWGDALVQEKLAIPESEFGNLAQ